MPHLHSVLASLPGCFAQVAEAVCLGGVAGARDPALSTEGRSPPDDASFEAFLRLGMLCTKREASERPTMEEVERQLTGLRSDSSSQRSGSLASTSASGSDLGSLVAASLKKDKIGGLGNGGGLGSGSGDIFGWSLTSDSSLAGGFGMGSSSRSGSQPVSSWEDGDTEKGGVPPPNSAVTIRDVIPEAFPLPNGSQGYDKSESSSTPSKPAALGSSEESSLLSVSEGSVAPPNSAALGSSEGSALRSGSSEGTVAPPSSAAAPMG